jgi:hypothetical protein
MWWTFIINNTITVTYNNITIGWGDMVCGGLSVFQSLTLKKDHANTTRTPWYHNGNTILTPQHHHHHHRLERHGMWLTSGGSKYLRISTAAMQRADM